MATIVMFVKVKEGDFSGDITAIFPTQIENNNGDVMCYAHVGQHSVASMEWVNESTVNATREEREDLLKELISIGYDDLIICDNKDIECWRNPTPYELKFGEGAIRYRSFKKWEIGYGKSNNLKKWFKADDGLRYNMYR